MTAAIQIGAATVVKSNVVLAEKRPNAVQNASIVHERLNKQRRPKRLAETDKTFIKKNVEWNTGQSQKTQIEKHSFNELLANGDSKKRK